MSYENAIETYHRIYEKTDAASLAALWAENRGDLNVYVHSPFCASICKFCYYKGVQFGFETDSPIYEEYYGRYLPRAVAPFRPLLESRTVGNYFFGGGTPSLMRPDTMRSVFALFPGFEAVRSKTFEIHPAIWTEEQLDVLAASQFNCCIIGIQSFDEKVLERQGRIHASFERVRELANEIRRRGMYLAVDVIYRMDEIDADAIFEKDLALLEELESDVISLQLNYDRVTDEECNQKFFQMIIASDLPRHYYWEGGPEISLDLKKTLKCFRYVKQEVPYETYARDVFPFIRSIDEGSKVLRPGLPSVIGFGSYRNPRKNTFSNIRSADATVEYIEVNDAWKPEYFITYDSRERDFFAECAKELERFREAGPPPKGIKISFENGLPRARENYIFRRIDGQVEVGVTWQYVNPEIEAYLARLKAMFPHWTWPKD